LRVEGGVGLGAGGEKKVKGVNGVSEV